MSIDNTIDEAINRAMAWMRGQVGKATGNSVWAIAYPQWVGKGYHWCGGFQVAAYKTVGIDLMKCAWWFYTPYIRNFAIKIGAWKTSGPEYGDQPLFDWQRDGVIDHVGAAWPDPNSSQYRSVEGNTSRGTAGSQSAGGGCWVRYRNRRDIAGWVDMRKVLRYMYANGLWNGTLTGSTTTTTPSVSNPYGGFTKEYIKNIQVLLNKLGYKLDVDGIRGPATISAVKDFQKKHGLVQDGLPGPATLAKLQEVTKGFLMALTDAEQKKLFARIQNIQDILTGYAPNKYVQKGYSLPLVGMRVRDVKDLVTGGGPRGEDKSLLRAILAGQEEIKERLDKLEGSN